MDVQYCQGIVPDTVENPVWVSAEQDHANAGVPCRTPSAFRPLRDVCDGTPDAAFDRGRDSRIVDDQPIDYCIKVVKRVFGADDLHLPRNYENAASTCW